MPIYEYEPCDGDCNICEGRIELIQNVHDDAFKFCPWCGQEVKRLISKATFKLDKDTAPDNAGRKGLTTFKRAEKGVWEKVGGEGPDFLVGSKEDMAQVEAEKHQIKKISLD